MHLCMKWVLSSSFFFFFKIWKWQETSWRSGVYRIRVCIYHPLQSSTSVSLVFSPAHLVLKPYENSISFPFESENLPCVVQLSFSWLLYLNSPFNTAATRYIWQSILLNRNNVTASKGFLRQSLPSPFILKGNLKHNYECFVAVHKTMSIWVDYFSQLKNKLKPFRENLETSLPPPQKIWKKCALSCLQCKIQGLVVIFCESFLQTYFLDYIIMFMVMYCVQWFNTWNKIAYKYNSNSRKKIWKE